MSAYNLKQHLNEWTNIEVSIDNNTGTVDLFVNGTQQQFAAGANVTADTNGSKSLNISGGKQFTKNSNSKFHIGGNKDKKKRFTGKMERIEFSNKARNAAAALASYQKLKKRESDSMMNMKFKPSTSRDLSESSKYKSKAKFNKQSGGATIETNSGRDAVKFSGGDYIEIDATTTMYGNKLLNSTFTSWVKLPSTSSGYEPIISRENVFSFGVNNGHASLFLSQNNQLAPGTNVSREASSAVTVGQAVSSVMEPTHENLLVDASFNTTDTKITKPASSEYSSIIPGSKVVKLTTSDKIEVDRTALIGKNMNKFTFSGWVNFSSLNDNAVLFERPDAGLKLSTNASGQVSLDFTEKTKKVVFSKSATWNKQMTMGKMYFYDSNNALITVTEIKPSIGNALTSQHVTDLTSGDIKHDPDPPGTHHTNNTGSINFSSTTATGNFLEVVLEEYPTKVIIVYDRRMYAKPFTMTFDDNVIHATLNTDSGDDGVSQTYYIA